MNLNQLKAKYAKGNETTNTGKEKAVLIAGIGVKHTNKVKDMATKATSAVKSAGSAVGGVMPASRKSVKDLAATMNDRFNNQEKEIFKNKLMLHMIAQATGVNLPSEEEMDELYEEYTKEEEREIKEINETEALAEVESTTTSTTSNIDVSAESNDIEDTTEEEEIEEQEEESAPAPKGRRKLGRQAPLAE